MGNIALTSELIIMRALNAKAHFDKAEIHLAKAKSAMEGKGGSLEKAEGRCS